MHRLRTYKPVSHQAPIVVTGRLSEQPPKKCSAAFNRDLKCYNTAQPGMLAFVENENMAYFPEPEYFCNVNGCERDDFSFLGVVQTPAKHGAIDRRNGAGEVNVIHAGGTMTTFNTGKEPIPANSLVAYDFPTDQTRDSLPEPWKEYYDSDHCKFAETVPVPSNGAMELYLSGRIIGRAIRRSEPGQQLDLILAQ